MVSRREREKLNRQNYIMNIAERLFIKYGYERTTMDEIAQQAEFSKTTLYKYFNSKDELLFLMHLRDAKKGYNFLKKCTRMGKNGFQKLYYYGDLLYQFYEKFPSKLLTRVYLDYISTIPRDIRDEAKKENQKQITLDYELVKNIIQEGINDGSIIGELNIDMTIAHFVYTLHPVLKQSFHSTHRFAKFNGKQYYYKYLDLFMRGIKPD